MIVTTVPAAVATNGKQVLLSGGAGESDFFFVQSYDAETGQFLWENQAAFASGFENAALAVDTEGTNVFVAGWYRVAFSQPGFTEAFVVRSYDAATGEARWVDEFSEPELFRFKLFHALDLAVTRGRVIAVGQEGNGAGRWFTRAHDPETGALLWSSTAEVAPLTTYGASQAVAVDHERIFVAGSGLNAQHNADFIIRPCRIGTSSGIRPLSASLISRRGSGRPLAGFHAVCELRGTLARKASPRVKNSA